MLLPSQVKKAGSVAEVLKSAPFISLHVPLVDATRHLVNAHNIGLLRPGAVLLEETADPAQFRGIDVLRAIRSFDPCMPCTTHIHTDAGVITREVNTCACGADDGA